MDPAGVAELQVLLEGVPLPNDRASLLRYALSQRASGEQLAMLQKLPDGRYDNIDEVGECLMSVQPAYEQKVPHTPHEESGRPPGGDAYTQLRPESGRVRDLDSVSSD